MKANELSLIRRIRFLMFGRVYLEHRQRAGWSGPLPFYLVRCSIHGPYEDYPHGWDDYFVCPECLELSGMRLIANDLS